jgi:hypothetical protein
MPSPQKIVKTTSKSPLADTSAPPSTNFTPQARRPLQPPVIDPGAAHAVAPEAAADAPQSTPSGRLMANGKSRVPLGRSKRKLQADAREGFMRRWINETPGRVEVDAPAAGWSHVMGLRNEPVFRVVDKQTGLKAYLMEIPLEYYNADEQAKQDSLDATDRAIYGGTYQEEQDDKRYQLTSTPIKFGTVRGSGRG